MLLYGENKFECRRKILLSYFGEDFDAADCNMKCDIC